MKAAELKAILATVDDDVDVFVEGYETGFDKATRARIALVVQVHAELSSDGQFEESTAPGATRSLIIDAHPR